MLAETNSLGAAVDHDHLSDHLRRRDRAPVTGIARRSAVVAEQEEVAARDAPRSAEIVSACRGDVRLAQPTAVHEHDPFPLADRFAAEADHAFDEHAGGAAADTGGGRRVEHRDVAALEGLDLDHLEAVVAVAQTA